MAAVKCDIEKLLNIDIIVVRQRERETECEVKRVVNVFDDEEELYCWATGIKKFIVAKWHVSSLNFLDVHKEKRHRRVKVTYFLMTAAAIL